MLIGSTSAETMVVMVAVGQVEDQVAVLMVARVVAQVEVQEEAQELVMDLVQEEVMEGKAVFMVMVADQEQEVMEVSKENQVPTVAILVNSRQTLLFRTRGNFKEEEIPQEML